MKKKRIVAIVCVISMIGGMLGACSSTEETTKKKKAQTETEEVSTKKSKNKSSTSEDGTEHDGGAPTSVEEETSKEDDQFVSFWIDCAFPFSEGRAWCEGHYLDSRDYKWLLIDMDGNVLYSADDEMGYYDIEPEDLKNTKPDLPYGAWHSPLPHMRVKNGITYLIDYYKHKPNEKSFVILDEDGNELYSVQAEDDEKIVIVNRCKDSFLVRKTVANMTNSTTSFYLIDKYGNQIGDFYFEGPTSEVGKWPDGNVYTTNDGLLLVSQQGVLCDVNPDTGAISATPYEMEPTLPVFDEREMCWMQYVFEGPIVESKYGSISCPHSYVKVETIALPNGISPNSIQNAEVSGDYYSYEINGADGKSYYGIADQTGNFLYEPLACDDKYHATSAGYLLFIDHIVTPEGKILSSLEEFQSLPTDLCLPEIYECEYGSGFFIREGFISLDLYMKVSRDFAADAEYSYVSIDGTKNISRVLEVEEN